MRCSNRNAVTAELICDGDHVHPALIAIAIARQDRRRMMAITDGTAGAGLPIGSRARLGDRPSSSASEAAQLDDGTLAGSILTMDGAFRTLVNDVKLSLSDASRMCSTTPADELGLRDQGAIEVGSGRPRRLGTGSSRSQTYLAGEGLD